MTPAGNASLIRWTLLAATLWLNACDSDASSSSAPDEGGTLDIPGEQFLATSVAVGSESACAITPSGEVACWGEGALGTPVQQQYFPVLVPGLADIVALRSDGDTACALSEAGTLACWGLGSVGQLGNDRSGDGYREDSPVAVVGLDEVADFSVSEAACAVRKDGTVWCWGSNIRERLGFKSEECGPYAILTDTVQYFEYECEARPRRVPGIESAVQVSVAADYQCAVLADESVVCWREDEVPTPVSGLSGVRKVAAGHGFTCALSTAGEVSCWGSNTWGTLGRGVDDEVLSSDATPAPVVGLGKVVDLDARNRTACAVTEDGEVDCWGETRSLLDATDTPHPSWNSEPAPVVVPYVSDAVQVSTQGSVACAVQASNELVCWGSSNNGATGNGRIEDYLDYSGHPVVWEP